MMKASKRSCYSIEPQTQDSDNLTEKAKKAAKIAGFSRQFSPVSSYLNEFDKFVGQKLIPQFHHGEIRRRNPEYRHYGYKKGLAKARNDRESYKAYDKKLRSVPALDPYDPDYRRLRYVRYADDCARRKPLLLCDERSPPRECLNSPE